VHEEDATDVEVVPSFAIGIPASIASAIDADEAPTGVQDDNSGDHTPDQEADGGSNGGDEVGSPRRCLWEACFKENFNGSVLLLHILFCVEEWGW
jgi:hypothetical protein